MFLEILITGTSLLILSYIGLMLYQKKVSEKIKMKTKETLLQYGTMMETGHDFTLQLGQDIYQILFVHVPIHAELTINSRNKWDIHQIGKSHLIDQTKRLSSPYQKIIIIYPSTLRIKRYINENEMVFVSHQDKVYDYYVVRMMDLEDLLKRLTQNA